MLKIVSENFIHALLLFLGLFLKISRWVPLVSKFKMIGMLLEHLLNVVHGKVHKS